MTHLRVHPALALPGVSVVCRKGKNNIYIYRTHHQSVKREKKFRTEHITERKGAHHVVDADANEYEGKRLHQRCEGDPCRDRAMLQ